jgi:hypothetical protein
MTIELNPKMEEFVKYLEKSSYEQTFACLVHARVQLNARKFLFDKTLQDIRDSMKISVDDKELGEKIKQVNALQLDIISKIFMLIEDLIYFYQFLIQNPKELPSMIAKNQRVNKRKVLDEWKSLDRHNIITIFKFTDPEKFESSEQKNVFEHVIERQVKLIQSSFLNISNFWDNYYDVYIVYKHGLSAIIGPYSTESGKLRPILLIRRYLKNVKRIGTYHIPVSPKTVDYYEQILLNTHSLLKLLIDSFTLYIKNREALFIPPLWEKELEMTKEENKVIEHFGKLFTDFPKSYNIEITIHEKRTEEMKTAFATKHIYLNKNFDIFREKPKYKN